MTRMASQVGGYIYQFLDTPADSLVCRICHCASREPYLSKCCGHTFCKSCLKGAQQAMAVRVCPMCRSEQFSAFANKQADRAVRSLHVFCTNKGKGCEWQGEVNDIINHLGNSDGCKLETVSCPNNCGITLERRCLTAHVSTKCLRREAECLYCHTTGQYLFIESEHKKMCPKFPIPCPNKCRCGSVPRNELKEHRKICPMKLIQCEYHVVGCQDRIIRKYQTRHNKSKMEEHLSLSMYLLNEVNNTQAVWGARVSDISKEQNEKFSQMEKDLATSNEPKENAINTMNLNLSIIKLQLQRVIDNKIENIRKEMSKTFLEYGNKLAAEKRRQSSNADYYKKILWLCFVSVLIVLVAWLMRASNTPAELCDKNSITTIKTELDNITQVLSMYNNQPRNGDQKIGIYSGKGDTTLLAKEQSHVVHKEVVQQESSILKWIYSLFGYYSYDETQSHDVTQSLNKWNNKLYSESSKLSSGNEIVPVIVKMTEYSKKYKNDVNWFSEPFYTYERRYQLCLNVRPAGEINYYNTHLSVKVVLLKGSRLSVNNCKVKLLNQISNSKRYSVSHYGQHHRDAVWYKSDFITNDYLTTYTNTWQYLKSDTIFFEIDCSTALD